MAWICIVLIVALIIALMDGYMSIGGRIMSFIGISFLGLILATFLCVIFATLFTPTVDNCNYKIEQHFLDPIENNYITFSTNGTVWAKFSDTGYYNDDTLDNNTYYKIEDTPYYLKYKWGFYKTGTLPWWIGFYAGQIQEEYYLNDMNICIS